MSRLRGHNKSNFPSLPPQPSPLLSGLAVRHGVSELPSGQPSNARLRVDEGSQLIQGRRVRLGAHCCEQGRVLGL